MKYFWAFIGLLLLAAAVFSWNKFNRPVSSLPPESVSAKLYQRGFYQVGNYDIAVKDNSRLSGDNKASQKMGHSITGQLWFPEIEEGFVAPGKHPLYLYIPHYQERATQFSKAASILASKGYIVVAIDPANDNQDNTIWTAISNIRNQIDDIRFLLDNLEEWNQSPDTPFYSRLAFGNVVLSSLSSGTISAQLLIFHPSLKDDRINAGIFIAPISHIFSTDFFTDNSNIPLLVVATNTDAVSNYETNAVYLAANAEPTWLVNIKQGDHRYFSEPEPFPLSWRPSNDINCEDLQAALRTDQGSKTLDALVKLDAAMFTDFASNPACEPKSDAEITGTRQRELSILAAQAFADSHFADTVIERDMALKFLTETLAQENPDVSVFPPIAKAN